MITAGTVNNTMTAYINPIILTISSKLMLQIIITTAVSQQIFILLSLSVLDNGRDMLFKVDMC